MAAERCVVCGDVLRPTGDDEGARYSRDGYGPLCRECRDIMDDNLAEAGSDL